MSQITLRGPVTRDFGVFRVRDVREEPHPSGGLQHFGELTFYADGSYWRDITSVEAILVLALNEAENR